MTLFSIFQSPPKVLFPFEPGSEVAWLDDIKARASEIEGCSLTNDLEKDQANGGQISTFLANVFSLSKYLREISFAHPDILAEVLASDPKEFIDTILQRSRTHGINAQSEAEIMAALRKEKKRVALALGLLDLGGWWTGQQVTQALSEFADAALYATTDFCLLQLNQQGKIELVDAEKPQENSGLIILAMGKHGACELNYSSDIDIILFFEERYGLAYKTDDPTTMYSRLAKQLVKIMQERTADGYVFRTDLRLRPDPGSTPPAIPVTTALHYYEAYGQNWERAAMIKARPAAGDIAAGQQLLKELSPFIWRKYLDYAAIQDVHSVKRQIHAHKGHGTIAVYGHNVKLGRGGIREIEFFVQTQQLIAGGRIPELRKIKTIDALNALCDLEWISAKARDELTECYWYLRDVEHRIQMVADEQTQTLPKEEEELLRIAKMMGDESCADFASNLTRRLETVQGHYAALFETSNSQEGLTSNLVFTGEDDDPGTLETLSTMGYERPSDIIRQIRAWHYGRYAAVQSATARAMLTELVPRLLTEISTTDKPDETFFALDRFIAGLPAGVQLFAILSTHPVLTRMLILILGSAPRLTEIITRKPHVFDSLLDPAFAETIPDLAMTKERYVQALSRSPNYEAQLDMARIFAAEQKFLIGVRLLNGLIDANQAGALFSDLADVLINGMLDSVLMEFEGKHGQIKGGQIAIVGMGRLGSHELTAGSDLDLILLYDHDEDADYSNGAKQLDVAQYYTRLTQRLITAMSAPTAEGVMYELDFRLRPSGNAGPLATHFESFSKYQRNDAWIWELQALTRARCIAGSAQLCQRIEAEIIDILSTPRDRDHIAREMASMRKRIDDEKATPNPWNIKSSKGGLIDIEFLGQWCTLCMLDKNAEERKTAIADMLELGRENLFAPGDQEELKEALTAYTAIMQISRLCLDSDFDPETVPGGLIKTICEQMNLPDVSVATAYLKETQATTRKIFERLVGSVES